VSGYQVVATGNWLALLEEKFIPAVGKDLLRSFDIARSRFGLLPLWS
jgi:hypothetical protein